MIKCLVKELQIRKSYLKKNELDSLYFGGGTPSVLNQEDIKFLIRNIKKYFIINKNTEITFECNPDDLSKEKLNTLKNVGINRLSIGIQSFKSEDLSLMNRSHDSKQAIECVKNAKAIGFKNISVDLIFSLPNQTIQDWKKNLEIVFDLGIQHISCYSLTIEEKTKLKHLIKSKKIIQLNEIESSKHFDLLVSECESQGFIQYEISNFGKEGFFSKHNSNYWTGGDYMGIGPSAHSYNGESRQWNIANNRKYIQKIKKGHLNYDKELLSKTQKYNDHIMTSLRTIWGIDLKFIKQTFGIDTLLHMTKESSKWINTNDLYIENDKVFLTDKGKFISDTICSDLFIVK